MSNPLWGHLLPRLLLGLLLVVGLSLYGGGSRASSDKVGRPVRLGHNLGRGDAIHTVTGELT